MVAYTYAHVGTYTRESLLENKCTLPAFSRTCNFPNVRFHPRLTARLREGKSVSREVHTVLGDRLRFIHHVATFIALNECNFYHAHLLKLTFYTYAHFSANNFPDTAKSCSGYIRIPEDWNYGMLEPEVSGTWLMTSILRADGISILDCH